MNILLPKIKEAGLVGIKNILSTYAVMLRVFLIGTIIMIALLFKVDNTHIAYQVSSSIWLLLVLCFGIKAAHKSLKSLGKWAWFGGLVGFIVPVIVGLPLIMIRGRARNQGEREFLFALWSGQMEAVLIAIIFIMIISAPILIGGITATISAWRSDI
ncbi:MAG: hypothetical protein KC662_04335 [Candidatus Magasanikbacteria bacterium]|nr:hypothetical protein [Candidatus Magasanikbacteria bacterium]